MSESWQLIEIPILAIVSKDSPQLGEDQPLLIGDPWIQQRPLATVSVEMDSYISQSRNVQAIVTKDLALTSHN